MKIARSQRDPVRRAGPEPEVVLMRGLDNVGIGYSKVILILRSTIHRRGSYIQVGLTQSMVNVTMSWNVRDTVRATLHPVLPGRNLILHKLVSKLD